MSWANSTCSQLKWVSLNNDLKSVADFKIAWGKLICRRQISMKGWLKTSLTQAISARSRYCATWLTHQDKPRFASNFWFLIRSEIRSRLLVRPASGGEIQNGFLKNLRFFKKSHILEPFGSRIWKFKIKFGRPRVDFRVSSKIELTTVGFFCQFRKGSGVAKLLGRAKKMQKSYFFEPFLEPVGWFDFFKVNFLLIFELKVDESL